MSQLGTLEELPLDYRQGLTARNLVPLWPNLRAALPYGIPSRRTKPVAWSYADVRPRLIAPARHGALAGKDRNPATGAAVALHQQGGVCLS